MRTAVPGISHKLSAATLGVILASLATFAGQKASAAPNARDAVIKLVSQIQRADYEGDRPALRRLYNDLAPFADNKEIGARVQYWRGFALWRRAINGFNETVDPKEAAADVADATEAFRSSFAKDPTFVDAKDRSSGLPRPLNVAQHERSRPHAGIRRTSIATPERSPRGRPR